MPVSTTTTISRHDDVFLTRLKINNNNNNNNNRNRRFEKSIITPTIYRI